MIHRPGSADVDIRDWPAPGRAVEYEPVKVKEILHQSLDPDVPWYWTLNPYVGCEFGCTFCHARGGRKDLAEWIDFEKRIGVKTNAVEAFWQDFHAQDFEGRTVVLGNSTEPWQQAEEKFRVTRAILAAMVKVDGLDLRINTRSSLIARDTDLLVPLAKKGRVTVAFSIASMEERVNRLMEPHAPSVFRRLAALEALARAGLHVGLVISPIFLGLDEDELGLEALVHRAANAGARFAGIRIMHFEPGERETFLANATQAYPQQASRFRRIVGRRPISADERQAFQEKFEATCRKVGLVAVAQSTVGGASARARPPEPAQMSLL